MFKEIMIKWDMVERKIFSAVGKFNFIFEGFEELVRIFLMRKGTKLLFWVYWVAIMIYDILSANRKTCTSLPFVLFLKGMPVLTALREKNNMRILTRRFF